VTAKTRRRVAVCLVALAFALPVETVLLHAIQTPSIPDVARAWVGSLQAGQLQTAAGSIEAFPFAYRREIMRALSPAQRATVWSRHIFQYIQTHPTLDPSVVAVLYNAAALVTPDTFAQPTDAVRAQIGQIAAEVQILLGASEADYLFYRLGPPDSAFGGAEPIGQRLANYVRNLLIVRAGDNDCDCSTSFGCDGNAGCSSSSGCDPVQTWPMCGWLWLQVCDGLCTTGYGGRP
jgi:hypothetical protein